MRISRVYCDRCRAELATGIRWTFTLGRIFTNEENHTKGDLCETCKDELEDFIAGRSTRSLTNV